MQENLDQAIGDIFRRTRLEMDLSLRGMGDELDVSHQHISNIEKATCPIQYEWLRELATRENAIGDMARRCLTTIATYYLQEVSHVN